VSVSASYATLGQIVRDEEPIVSSEYLTTDQVAALAGVTPDNIRKLRLRGAMPPAEQRDWRWVWPADVIEEWVQHRPKRGPRPQPRYAPAPGQPWTVGTKLTRARATHVIVASDGTRDVTACGLRERLGNVRVGPKLDALAKEPWPLCVLCGEAVQR
jgi:hypothetical protein